MPKTPLTRFRAAPADVPEQGGGRIPSTHSESHRATFEKVREENTRRQNNGKPRSNATIETLTEEFSRSILSLSDLLKEISRRRNQPSKPLDFGEVQIGLTRLKIPPERVTIQEIPQNMEVQGLRTDGTTLIKSGRGRIHIVLDLVFEGESQINGQLRELVAQFRGYPYVPIVSPYIASVVQPRIQRKIPEKAKKDIDAELTAATRQLATRKDDVVRALDAFLQANPAFAVRLNADTVDGRRYQEARGDFLSETQKLLALNASFGRLVDAINRVVLAGLPTEVARGLQDLSRFKQQTADALVAMQRAIMRLEQLRFTRVQLEVGGLIDVEEDVVPACLDQLQVYTVPGRPRLLRAKLVLVFFNPTPYGGILQYVDLLGRPTVDPNEATFMRTYLENGWLRDPYIPDLPGASFSPLRAPHEYLRLDRTVQVRGLGRVSDTNSDGKSSFLDELQIGYFTTEMESEDPTETVRRIEEGEVKITESLNTQAPVPRTLDLKADQGATLQSVTVSLANRLALQPVQGEFYPSMQYMGGKPAYATVTLMVTNDELLRELHAMKIANQQMSLLGIRHWRRPEVHVRNSILNLMGIFTAQLDDITTQSISPNTTEVTLRLVEHRIDIAEREQITRAQLFSRDRIRRAFLFLFDQSRKYVELRNKVGDVRHADVLLGPTILRAKGLAPSDLRGYAAGERAFTVLFGDPEAGIDPVLSPEVVSAAFFLTGVPGADAVTQEAVRQRILADHAHTTVISPRESENPFYIGQALLLSDGRSSYTSSPSLTTITTTNGILKKKPEEQAKTIVDNYQGRGVLTEAQQPTDLELGLLTEHLMRSSGNASDELVLSEDGTRIKVQRRDGSDKTPDIQALLGLARAILNNDIQPPDGPGIRSLVLEGTTLRDFLRSKRDFPSLLYPDLLLPTFGQALAPILEAIEQYRIDRNGQRLLQGFLGTAIASASVRGRLTSVRDKDNPLTEEERQILNLFLPTFRQIGKPPDEADLRSDDFAYDLDDDVLPDFFYFGQLDRSTLERADQEAYEALDGLTDSQKKRRDDDGRIPKNERLQDPLSQDREQRRLEQKDTGKPDEGVRKSRQPVEALGTVVNTEQLTTELYAPGGARAEFSDFGVDTEEQIKRIFDASAATIDDNRLRLQRCFPTIRLFFIEEDTGEGVWRAIDDVYGYNSIVSATVTRHKSQSDLAEIVITNFEGNLEYDKFDFTTAKDQKKEPPITSAAREGKPTSQFRGVVDSAAPSEPGTREKPLKKFPLAEGTRVVIQMGYHSKAQYLETVFTGKIAEIQMGDMIVFRAQGYLQELLFPMVKNPNTERTRGVIEDVMASETVEHFGRWTPASWMRLSSQELENARQHSFLTSISDSLGVVFSDPKMRNVFAARYGTWWGETLHRLFLQEKWEVGGGTRTGWDVINDIIGFTPGYIAAVVPYDLEATLFVGRPEQPYFWTDGLRDLESKWHRERAQARPVETETAIRFLANFRNSSYYDGGVRRFLTRAAGPGSAEVRDVLEKLAALISDHPYWAIKVEAAFRAVEIQQKDSLEGITGLNFVDVARNRDVLRNVLLQNELSRSPASHYAEIIRLVGANQQRAVLDLIGRELQGTAPIELGSQRQVSQAHQALIELRAPASLFRSLWSGQRLTLERIELILRGALWQDEPSDERKRNLAEVLLRFSASIPVLLRSLRDYLRAEPLLVALSSVLSVRTKNTWPMNPRTRPFRSYHFVSSLDDLIDNQIVCTRGAMWNGVAISAGSDTPQIIWADDGIVKGDRQLRVFHEPNADLDLFNVTNESGVGGFTNNRLLIGFTRIAQGLRPMYRGQIVCRGRPDIKPWDIVYLEDTYNFIRGPVEVERVTHHFSMETGFITTIVPHAVAIPNNQVDSLEVMVQGWKMGLLGAGLVFAGGALFGGLGLLAGVPVAIGLGLGGAGAVQTITDELLTAATGTGIVGNFAGVGRYGGAFSPVKLFPLSRMGSPWTAALRGFGKSKDKAGGLVYETSKAIERFKGRVADAATATEFLWEQWVKPQTPEELNRNLRAQGRPGIFE